MSRSPVVERGRGATRHAAGPPRTRVALAKAGTPAWRAFAAMVLLVSPLVVASTTAAAQTGPDVPPGAGVRAPGVNLFEFIDWRRAEASSPCGVGGFSVGPGNRIAYDEAAQTAGLNVPLAGCAVVTVPYRAPYPADHLHLRFLRSVNNTWAADQASMNATATVELRGPGGQVPPTSILGEDLAFPEFASNWVQDPGPDLPLFFEDGVDQAGRIEWRFADLSGEGDAAGPTPTGPRRLRADLASVLGPPGVLYREDRLIVPAPSHVEYSYVDLPGMEVVRQRVTDTEGRVQDETHFTVTLDEPLLAEYGASIQLDADLDMVFARLILPNGTLFTRTGGVFSPDWRELRFENVHLQLLGDEQERFWQVMVPYTLVELAGPGTYTIVMQRPSAAVAAVDDALKWVVATIALLPAAVGAYAARNVRRYRDALRPGWPLGAKGMVVSLATVTVGYVAYLLFVTARVGWDRLARPGMGPLTLTTLILLLVIGVLYGAIAARSSARAARATRREIEERRRMMASLERSNRDLELFASAAAHDLGAPLRSVRKFSEIVRERYGHQLEPQGRELLEHAVGGSERMQGLLDDLLEFSRVQAGREEHTPVELDDVLSEATLNLASEFEATGAIIEWGTIPAVQGQRAALVRLFQNLVANAIKFRRDDRHPHVRISAVVEGERVVVSVADNGTGIPDGDHERVFQPFYRSRRERRLEGAGLGLALVQRIVEAHGGRVWATPASDGGTTVHVELPLADEGPADG